MASPASSGDSFRAAAAVSLAMHGGMQRTLNQSKDATATVLAGMILFQQPCNEARLVHRSGIVAAQASCDRSVATLHEA